MKTFIVGIGAQKAGTSWLHDYLSAHPDVWMSPIKELHYWDWRYRPELSRTFHDRFLERLEDAKRNGNRERQIMLEDRLAMADDERAYMRFFETRAGDRPVFGEITPAYSLLPEAGFRRLRAQHDNTKIVLLLRDPVDRLWSGVCHFARRKDIAPEAEFETALSNPQHMERTRYDLTLARLDATFDTHDVFVEFYENLFTQAAIERLTSFLGIAYREPDFQRRVHAHPQPQISVAAEDLTREALAPVYRHCRERFGDRLPSSWRG